jgi:Zn-dependent protease with chaperone function
MDIKLSDDFKTQTTKAILAILLFILIYVIILILAIGLAVFCVYAAFMLVISAHFSVITIGFGVGLASLGILVLIFLIKFMFKSNKTDRSHLVEITRKDEPKLFKMIDKLVLEVGTSFPKKVYLSADVNAGVFYDSSFWSMILPIQKNLHIGLGLVNSITKDELRAILAHEFGHFSQRTMKVGSYVYNVNQVIYNMLYDNDGYHEGVKEWAQSSGYVYIFVLIAVKINEAIQWILKQLYNIVNVAYMSLSREMEFHADEIAAHITGYPPMKDALLRMNLADHAYNSALNYYNEKINLNQKCENIYRDQAFIIHFLAKEDNISFKNDLPMITMDDMSRFNKSKLVIKDQWASHPSTEERIERLEAGNIIMQHLDNTPANEIFTDIASTQKRITEKILANVKYSGDTSSVSFDDFKKEFTEEHINNSFSKIYNGYYDSKNPMPFDFEEAVDSHVNETKESLFSDQNVDLVYQLIALQNDTDTLKQIAEPNVTIKSFDYDGKKYKKSESVQLANNLTTELEKLSNQVKQMDMTIFKFFHQLEQQQGKVPELENLYKSFFNYDEEFRTKYATYIEISDGLQFIPFTTPIETIKMNFLHILPVENILKREIKSMLDNEIYRSEMTADMKDNFEMYISREWTYFGNQSYFDKNLEMLYKALNNYAYLLKRRYFILKKNILKYQEELFSVQ